MPTASINVEAVQRFAAAIIRDHLPDRSYRIFLFGSRASGTARDRSDIDIGIEGPVPVPPHVMSDIAEVLEELPTLYSIDVVDFRRISDRFRRVAQERRYLDLHNV
jgi:predicted nucleotidyltransferase